MRIRHLKESEGGSRTAGKATSPLLSFHPITPYYLSSHSFADISHFVHEDFTARGSSLSPSRVSILGRTEVRIVLSPQTVAVTEEVSRRAREHAIRQQLCLQKL
mmetsp:Transcript_31183/g.100049  ORF Transcript_31183/g.100049 Transcript_31183/m.100049 type:complete len:104 (-) Transcript_31183:83-394(-)